jgi:uncharacterized protein involved in outer membrane biogenesis
VVGRLLGRFAIVVGALLALAIAVLLVLLLVGIELDLGRFRAPLGAQATEALGRTVVFEGPILLVPSFWPTLEIQELRVADPHAPDGAAFARFERVRVQLHLLPLLRRRVRIQQFRAEGVELRLRRYADGRANWAFDRPERELEAAAPEEGRTEEGADETGARVFLELEELSLQRIALRYHDETSGAKHHLTIDECSGQGATGGGLDLSILGAYQEHPFTLALSMGTLADLLKAEPESPVDFSLEIAGLRIELDQVADASPAGGATDDDAVVDYRLSVTGKRLDSLDALAGVALPPLGPYALGARMRAVRGDYSLSELDLHVGETVLTGKARFESRRKPPRASVELRSAKLRIDDFDTGEWSPARGESARTEPDKHAKTDAAETMRSLLDPSVMRSLDAKLTVRMDDVRSGGEGLGGGRLQASLEGGRFAIEPLAIDLPGGSFQATFALAPQEASTHVRVMAKIEGFDLGVPARRADPETDMGGLLRLDVELESRSPGLGHVMQHANGHVDFSLVPENLKSGILDLWAVNLLAAVLPLVDSGSDSHVNCVVALLDVEEGRMHQQSILIDTTRIQVEGEAAVDFETGALDVVLKPRPKKPQFFSLATPIRVDGSISDFGVGVAPADLLGTVIRFGTGVVTYPVRRMLIRSAPADGKQACAAAMRREG